MKIDFLGVRIEIGRSSEMRDRIRAWDMFAAAALSVPSLPSERSSAATFADMMLAERDKRIQEWSKGDGGERGGWPNYTDAQLAEMIAKGACQEDNKGQ